MTVGETKDILSSETATYLSSALAIIATLNVHENYDML